MNQPSPLLQTLLNTQNADGGWGFQKVVPAKPSAKANSWTEPTAFVLLALHSVGELSASARAINWLAASQRQDGGWAPRSQVDVSTWVTSLAILSLLQQPWQGPTRSRALNFFRQQVQPPESLWVQLLSRLSGQPAPELNRFGRPWYPGTAAWIYPTSIAVITLLQLERLTGDPSFGEFGRKGQEYILAHRCSDGGWNHGGTHLANENPFSYPETTGLALLALGGVPKRELSSSLEKAQVFLADPASGEGLSWLQLGLARHGITTSASTRTFPARTPREVALQVLALSAQNPRNPFTSPNSVVRT